MDAVPNFASPRLSVEREAVWMINVSTMVNDDYVDVVDDMK